MFLVGPIQVPNTFQLLKQHDQLLGAGGPWKQVVMQLENTKHGGPIKTSHQVMGLLEPASADHFGLIDHTVERPTGMDLAPSDAPQQ